MCSARITPRIPDMVDRDGNPTHAVFGFARFIGDLIERVRPQYMAVAFDQRLPNSYRSRIYPAYKANREPHPGGPAGAVRALPRSVPAPGTGGVHAPGIRGR